jgi:hypothetical protein
MRKVEIVVRRLDNSNTFDDTFHGSALEGDLMDGLDQREFVQDVA